MRNLLTITVLLFFGCGQQVDQAASLAESDEQSTETASNGVYEIFGIDENLSDHDLQPVGSLLGNIPVVALGESIHYSGGYYQAKFRLVKFLVTNHGFRNLSFETNRTAAKKLQQYVESCDGPPEDAIIEGLSPVGMQSR